MDNDETRTLLFGTHLPLSKTTWTIGLGVYLFAAEGGIWKARVMLAQAHPHCLLNLETNVVHKITAQWQICKQPVFLLCQATEKLALVQQIKPLSDIHRQALALECIFGTTFYLSSTVIKNMAPGQHVFSIGGSSDSIQTMTFAIQGTVYTLNDQPLVWKKKYAMLQDQPVFILVAVGQRICENLKSKKK